HPTHPTDMIVWRTPDGVPPAEVLDAELPEGQERIAAREAQGCIQIEVRAMFPDELELAAVEDDARLNPPLPFGGSGGGTDGTPAASDDATSDAAAGAGFSNEVGCVAGGEAIAESGGTGDRQPAAEETSSILPNASHAGGGAEPGGFRKKGKELDSNAL